MDTRDRRELIAALAESTRPLDSARTLPRAVYTAPEVLAVEWRELFGRAWLAVARERDLPESGCFVTHEVGAERILLVRGMDRRLRALFNVCRHRGARLVEEPAGRLRDAIACPYHAWTYGLDGRYLRAPRTDTPLAPDLDLTVLPLTVRDGFVFINLDPAAPPLAVAHAGLPDFGAFRLGELRRAHRIDYRVEANWKIVAENYSECYHCPLVHPQLSRIADLSSGGFEDGACFNGGPMRLRTGFDTMSLSGRSARAPLRPAAGDESSLVHYYLVYPNLMLGLHPDYVLVHTVWPLTAEHSRVVCEWLFAPETLDTPGFDPTDAIEFWDLTNRQDWALCERVQRGAGSRGNVPGPFHPSERCVHAFDRWYGQWLSAALESAAAS